jgi:hypothetical protein
MTTEEYMEKKALQDEGELLREGIRDALKYDNVIDLRFMLRELLGEDAGNSD